MLFNRQCNPFLLGIIFWFNVFVICLYFKALWVPENRNFWTSSTWNCIYNRSYKAMNLSAFTNYNFFQLVCAAVERISNLLKTSNLINHSICFTKKSVNAPHVYQRFFEINNFHRPDFRSWSYLWHFPSICCRVPGYHAAVGYTHSLGWEPRKGSNLCEANSCRYRWWPVKHPGALVLKEEPRVSPDACA